MRWVTYGDPAVDKILVEAETFAFYGLEQPLRGRREALLTLPETPARAAGLVRVDLLIGGAPSLREPVPPTPYIVDPGRSLPVPVTGRVVARGTVRRAPYSTQQMVGCTADEVRAVLGDPDSEEKGRHWFSHDTGRNVVLLGDQFIEDEMDRPAPNIEPRRPYVIWTYGSMVGPADPDYSPNTWQFYFFVSEAGRPTIVAEAGAFPEEIEF